MNDEQIQMLIETVERGKSNTHRIDELSARVDDYGEMVSTIKVLANEQGHIKDDVTEIKTAVTELAAKPGKRWETVVEKVLLLIVGAVAAWIFTKIGL